MRKIEVQPLINFPASQVRELIARVSALEDLRRVTEQEPDLSAPVMQALMTLSASSRPAIYDRLGIRRDGV